MKSLFARFTLIAAVAAVSITPAFAQKAPAAAEKKEIRKETVEAKQDSVEENTSMPAAVEERQMAGEAHPEMNAEQQPDSQNQATLETMEAVNHSEPAPEPEK